MKAFKNKKMKTILLSGAMALVAVASLALGVSFMKPVNANAATLLPTDYRTDGASVRVMTINEEGEYEEAAKKGIRFHVEMGANYKVPNTDTLLLDTNATNSNGSYKMAEGYKTYTLAIPTRLLNGELTVNTPTVKKIDTTNYWFSDLNGNWESVAYIHSFPVEYYTDDLSFRGIICKVEGDTETVVASTETEERSLTGVAKKAYIDTIDENSIYWGTAENDTKVAPILKDFIPTYTVDYGAGVTEEVMWGDKLTKADANKNYYDETNCEPVEVELPLTYPVSTDIKIAETKEGKFVFTGVQYTTNGFNVFTTLPATAFTQDSVLSPSALDMKLGSGEALTANSVKVHIDGAGDGAKVLLVVEFDYEDISYGESLTILNSSHFYNDGYFYEVEQDYTFVFYNAAWELALGTISLGDIESIKNYTETVNGVEEKNIRITFRNDILVNGAVTIGTTNGNGGIIIERAEDDYATVVEITDGYYYWNQGQNMILELPGTSDIWGEAEDDILTIAEGTRLYQNNGYYVVESDIYAFYDGAEDWWFELDERSANATAFSSAKTFQEGNSIYVDVFTKLAWGNKAINVVSNDGVITYHNKNNVTSYVPSKVVYHGEGGYNALRIHIEAKSELGDWITIPKNTELWIGSTKMTILEDLTFYYLGVDGGNWVLNPTFNEVGRDDFVSIYWSGNNIRYDTKEIWSTLANNRVIMDDTYIEGDGVILEGSVYSKFYYYGGSNNVFEMQGVNFSAEGGTATLKAGVVFWLLSNTDSSLTGAYRLTEDIILEVAGANGSQIYQDVELASISSANIASVTNDSENGGEIRFNLKGTLFSKVYSSGNLEGSATLNGAKTSTGYVYGGDGTSGYTGNSIISFTSTGFGAPFQATNPGDRVVIEAGTKIWLNSGSGYVTIADTWDYTWTGEKFVPTAPEGTKYTVTVNATNATVEMLTDATVAIGGSVRFNVTANEGFAITGVPGATENGDGTYTVSNIYENKVINVKAAVRLDASSIERFYTYIGKGEDKFVGIRVEIKDTAALRMLPENYGGTLMAGEVTIAANGATVTPTSYQSYGP
ncbi:MAG: hypothetical protein J6S04_03620, partial [Clostridia bacterium]|nr:hypothetical protein [Clostridia bacterium]